MATNGEEKNIAVRWDLRSDTVTKPTQTMREAMRDSLVGDDVWGDDPTVQKLEELGAKLLGKDASLFVPSGTMANLVAILTHCSHRGAEMIVGHKSHIHEYEQGGCASLGGVHPRVVPNLPDGTMDLDVVEHAIRVQDDHYPTSRLIVVENTHNGCGGKVVSLAFMDDVGALAKKHGLLYHCDGARLPNAAAALGVSMKRVVQACDTVSLCLSKGLAAPIGSLLAGPKSFIAEARRNRKALGGGMRQVGVIAAPGLLALTEMLPRVGEDNANAKALAVGLSNVPGCIVDVNETESNMVFLRFSPGTIKNTDTFTAHLMSKGVLAAERHGIWRLVLHYHVAAEDVSNIVEAFRSAND